MNRLTSRDPMPNTMTRVIHAGKDQVIFARTKKIELVARVRYTITLWSPAQVLKVKEA